MQTEVPCSSPVAALGQGVLRVTVGGMFAGKSTEALNVVRRYSSIGACSLVVKHTRDVARSGNRLCTHDDASCRSTVATELVPLLDSPAYALAALVVVEEAHFFADLYAFCVTAVERDRKSVFVYGLDADYLRRPFPTIVSLLPIADSFSKAQALCATCRDGQPAVHTLRRASNRTAGDVQVQIGGADAYEAACRRCYLAAMTLPSRGYEWGNLCHPDGPQA